MRSSLLAGGAGANSANFTSRQIQFSPEQGWILADGVRAGFALLNRYAPSGQDVDRAIAEFCVLPAFRRTGIGTAAALAALKTTVGWWELQVFRATPAAMAFWPKVLAAAALAEWRTIDAGEKVIHRVRTA